MTKRTRTPKAKSRKVPDREQSKLFTEKAREIGADNDVNVDEVMRRLAKQPRRDREMSAKRAPKK